MYKTQCGDLKALAIESLSLKDRLYTGHDGVRKLIVVLETMLTERAVIELSFSRELKHWSEMIATWNRVDNNAKEVGATDFSKKYGFKWWQYFIDEGSALSKTHFAISESLLSDIPGSIMKLKGKKLAKIRGELKEIDLYLWRIVQHCYSHLRRLQDAGASYELAFEKMSKFISNDKYWLKKGNDLGDAQMASDELSIEQDYLNAAISQASLVFKHMKQDFEHCLHDLISSNQKLSIYLKNILFDVVSSLTIPLLKTYKSLLKKRPPESEKEHTAVESGAGDIVNVGIDLGSHTATFEELDWLTGCSDFAMIVFHERSKLESRYAEKLHSWHKKWSNAFDGSSGLDFFENICRSFAEQSKSLASSHDKIAKDLLKRIKLLVHQPLQMKACKNVANAKGLCADTRSYWGELQNKVNETYRKSTERKRSRSNNITKERLEYLKAIENSRIYSKKTMEVLREATNSCRIYIGKMRSYLSRRFEGFADCLDDTTQPTLVSNCACWIEMLEAHK